MAAGHLLLHGWNLTFASYWTSDAPSTPWLFAWGVCVRGFSTRDLRSWRLS